MVSQIAHSSGPYKDAPFKQNTKFNTNKTHTTFEKVTTKDNKHFKENKFLSKGLGVTYSITSNCLGRISVSI